MAANVAVDDGCWDIFWSCADNDSEEEEEVGRWMVSRSLEVSMRRIVDSICRSSATMAWTVFLNVSRASYN